jgi:hypothetical protein
VRGMWWGGTAKACGGAFCRLYRPQPRPRPASEATAQHHGQRRSSEAASRLCERRSELSDLPQALFLLSRVLEFNSF